MNIEYVDDNKFCAILPQGKLNFMLYEMSSGILKISYKVKAHTNGELSTSQPKFTNAGKALAFVKKTLNFLEGDINKDSIIKAAYTANGKLATWERKYSKAECDRTPLRIERDNLQSLATVLYAADQDLVKDYLVDGGKELEVYVKGKLVWKTLTLNAMGKITSPKGSRPIKKALENIKNQTAVLRWCEENNKEPFTVNGLFLPAGVMTHWRGAWLYDPEYRFWGKDGKSEMPVSSL